MRFVELKSQDQLDTQTLHRSRDRLVGERTALINQLRAILLERGLVAPKGKRKLAELLVVLIDEQNGAGLSPRMVLLVADARAQWAELDRRIAAFDAAFIRCVKGSRRGATIDRDQLGLARSSHPRACRRRRRASIGAGIVRRGSASSRANSRPAANRSGSASANGATATFAAS